MGVSRSRQRISTEVLFPKGPLRYEIEDIKILYNLDKDGQKDSTLNFNVYRKFIFLDVQKKFTSQYSP